MMERNIELNSGQMGPEIVFPAAGFMAMAVEAIYQSNEALTQLESRIPIEHPRYRLRNVTFDKALVLEEGEEHKIMLTLTPVTGGNSDWHEFVVSSLIDVAWKENSRGLVRVEENIELNAPEDTLRPLAHNTPGQMWYKAMSDVGYNFGPLFRKQLEVESTSGERHSRSRISFTEPESAYPQSHYPIHPVCIDGCLQSSAPSLWKGNRTSINAVLVPAIIDEVIITSRKHPEIAIADTTSTYTRLGRREEPKSYMSNVSVFDPSSRSLLFRVSGLRYHKLDTQEDQFIAHTYSQVTWKPDITFLQQEALDEMAKKGSKCSASSNQEDAWDITCEIIDLVVHKTPNMNVMEVNMMRDDSTSAWLEGGSFDMSARAACPRYHYTSVDANTLIAAQAEYEGRGNSQFSLLDISKPKADLPKTENGFGLVIIRLPVLEPDLVPNIVRNARALLSDGGQFLLVEHSTCGDDFVAVESQVQICDTVKTLAAVLEANDFYDTRHVPCEQSNVLRSVTIATAKPRTVQVSPSNQINLVRFTSSTPATQKIEDGLKRIGWDLKEYSASFELLEPKAIVLVMDELSSALLPTIQEKKWEGIKALTQAGKRILWVTKGSQFDVTEPDRAMIHGLFRTVRAEDPSVSVTTLDVENPWGSKTLGAIDSVLRSLQQPPPKSYVENEYVERGGVISICRILPNHPVNHAEEGDRDGADLQERDLHDAETCIRLQCERLGIIDSLCYSEVDSANLPLPDGCVEVEIAAAGLNFKDIAVTMGIVPENQHLLGLEGAGVIRRVGSSASQFTVGQRVVVFEKGTFANRVIATTERTYGIPDNMSFEVRLI